MNISKILSQKIDRKTLSLIKQAGNLADSMSLPAYLVGGMVRDAFLGIASKKDIDITVEGDGLAFARTLADDLCASYKGFEKFRTARIFLNGGQRIDVASARSEEYPAPGMLPVVELAAINQDLYRRDFTVNAMAVRINRAGFGGLLDPFNGQADLQNKILRVLHDRSFIDDPTRLLRFIRFQSRFGLKPDDNTMELFNAGISAGVFEAVSGERIREELVLILKEKNAAAAVCGLEKSGAMAEIAPGVKSCSGAIAAFEKIEGAQRRIAGYGADPLKIKLAVVLSASPDKYASGFMDRLKFANDWKTAVFGIRRARSGLKILEKKLLPGKIHGRLEGARPEALAYLEIMEGKTVSDNVVRYRSALKKIKLSITGRTLVEMGIKPGKICGSILKELLVAKLNGGVKGRKQELAFVKRFLERRKR